MAHDSDAEKQLRDSVIHELKQVIDPELGVPITDLQLVDKVDIEDRVATVNFHLTMPFCPDELVLMMAGEIRRRLNTLPEIDEVDVIVTSHVHADQINQHLKEGGQQAA